MFIIKSDPYIPLSIEIDEGIASDPVYFFHRSGVEWIDGLDVAVGSYVEVVVDRACGTLCRIVLLDVHASDQSNVPLFKSFPVENQTKLESHKFNTSSETLNNVFNYEKQIRYFISTENKVFQLLFGDNDEQYQLVAGDSKMFVVKNTNNSIIGLVIHDKNIVSIIKDNINEISGEKTQITHVKI